MKYNSSEREKETIMEEQLKGKCDYFTQFVKECVKELKVNKTCLVFNKDQADIIMDMFPSASMKESDLGYVINLPKKKAVRLGVQK